MARNLLAAMNREGDSQPEDSQAPFDPESPQSWEKQDFPEFPAEGQDLVDMLEEQPDKSQVEPSEKKEDAQPVAEMIPDSQPADPKPVADRMPDLNQSGGSSDQPEMKRQKTEKTDAARELHRADSRAWHEKWVKKGIPRNPASDPAPPAPGLPPATLSKARDRFISEWIQASDMPPSQERFKKACKAWMESSARADYMAARAGVQK